MKKHVNQEVSTANLPGGIEPTDESVNQTLKNIHQKMMSLYHFNFACINGVKVVKQSELLNQLFLRMRTDLEKNGAVYSYKLWGQITDTLNNNQTAGLFDNFAFYNPKEDILYLNRDMMITNTEKTAPTCAHELAEKLLFTHISPSLDKRVQAAANLFTEDRKSLGTEKYCELLNIYIDTALIGIFKEGCCEMIALQTLYSMSYDTTSWEKELQTGYSKCKGLLTYMDNFRNSLEEDQLSLLKDKKREPTAIELEPVKKFLGTSQIVKGVSYFLGYPLAKIVLEKYGISGINFALEEYPPLKGRYFTDPQTYQVELEKAMLTGKWR
ncbi:MAG: hypothetical protein ABSA75_14470 [Candidatus Bathyarchaeia archaeon]|jgi:hypothetical protein